MLSEKEGEEWNMDCIYIKEIARIQTGPQCHTISEFKQG